MAEKIISKSGTSFAWSGLIRKISITKRGRSSSVDLRLAPDVHVFDPPAPPPPPYKSTPPSSTTGLPPSHVHIRTEPKDNNIARPRKLSKPRNGVDSIYAPSAFTSARTSVFSTPSATSPASPTSPSSTTRSSHYIKSSHARSTQNLDSSGRPRPPVSGVKPPNSNTSSSSSGGAHGYHYKRARAASSSEGTRVQEAINCLQAVLDAYEAGALTDIRHVVEQAELARNILVGEDTSNPAPVPKLTTGPGADAAAAVNAIMGEGSSLMNASVTSIATAPSYLPSKTVLRA